MNFYIYCPCFYRNNSISGTTSLKALRKESLLFNILVSICEILNFSNKHKVSVKISIEVTLPIKDIHDSHLVASWQDYANEF